MKILIKTLATAVLVVFPVAQAVAQSFYSQPMALYRQTNPSACGAGVSQAWIYHIKQSHSAVPSTWQIYRANWRMLNGASAGNMEDVLERFTGKGFQHHDDYWHDEAEDRLENEQVGRRPIAISAATRYADGRAPRVGGHWMLVWASNLRRNHPWEIQWVRLIDPLSGASGSSGYVTTSPRQYISRHELFTGVWIPRSNRYMESVED